MVGDRRLPSALDDWTRIRARLQARRLLLFLSYDGALAPLVTREDMAVLSRGMKDVLRQLAGLCPTVIVSRRGRQDLASMVDIDGLYHAGSDGLDFSGPGLRAGREPKWSGCGRFAPSRPTWSKPSWERPVFWWIPGTFPCASNWIRPPGPAPLK